MDILSERGYRISVDKRSFSIPIRVDPQTFMVLSEKRNIYVFDIRFPRHLIREVFGGGNDINPKDLASGVDETER